MASTEPEEKTSNSFSGVVKQSLFTYTSNASMHGFRNITDTEKPSILRVKWCIFVVVMISSLLYNIVHMKIEQSKYPSTSKISTESEGTLDFPAVTICNKSPYSTAKFTMTEQLRTYMFRITEIAPLMKPINWSLPAYMEIESENMTHWHDMASFKLKELLQQCFFNGIPIECSEHFVASETDIGRCYTFNKNKTFKAEMTGYRSGLTVKMNVDQNHYAPSPFMSAGALVGIHDPEIDPSIVTSIATHMSPGTDVYIALKPRKFVYLPEPYKVNGQYCTNANAGASNPLKYHERYEDSLCLRECLVIGVLKKCGCCQQGTEGTWNMPACSRRTYMECYIPEFVNGYMKHAKEKFQNCNCSTPCSRTEYTTDISTSLYPSDIVASVFGAWVSKEFIRDNFIELHVYFNTLTMTKVEYHPVYTWDTIFVQLGGFMGLFLGASILSVMEILELILTLVWRGIGKRSNATSPRMGSSSTNVQKIRIVN